MLSIQEVSEATGIGPTTLRMWERRYGWPLPCRQTNGYRVFPPGIVHQLRRVQEWRQAGHVISDLVKDGMLVGPPGTQAGEVLPRLAACAVPEDATAREVFEQLAAALRHRNVGRALEVLHTIAARVRPQLRVAASSPVHAAVLD